MSSVLAKRAGFSLIEIVIALAIFSFSILAVVGLMGSSLKVTRDSEEKIQAANLAQVIVARYQAMLESKVRGETVNFSQSPLSDTVSSNSPPKAFTAAGSGQYVDAFGNATGNENTGVFGLKSMVWRGPWQGAGESGGMIVYCSLQFQWPTAAVSHNQTANTYTTTTSFVITP